MLAFLAAYLLEAETYMYKRLVRDANWIHASAHLGATVRSGSLDVAQATDFFVRLEGSRIIGIAVCTKDIKAAIIPGDVEGWEELAAAISKAEYEDWRAHAAAFNSAART
jgi:hypothetical protein